MTRGSRARVLLAFLALGASACRDARIASGSAYCRYTETGPLCAYSDPSAVPFAAPLVLRDLDSLDPADRRLIQRHASTMTPRPNSLHALVPVGPFPEGRSPAPTGVPQAVSTATNARIAVIALGNAPGRADLYAFNLAEDRIASVQLMAPGLRTAGVRGLSRNGFLRPSFSLADRPGSVGDLYLWRPGRNAPRSAGQRDALQGYWQRIAADSAERKTYFFESITNSGSCVSFSMPLLLAPAPQSWLDEYVTACTIHPDMAMLRRWGAGGL